MPVNQSHVHLLYLHPLQRKIFWPGLLPEFIKLKRCVHETKQEGVIKLSKWLQVQFKCGRNFQSCFRCSLCCVKRRSIVGVAVFIVHHVGTYNIPILSSRNPQWHLWHLFLFSCDAMLRWGCVIPSAWIWSIIVIHLLTLYNIFTINIYGIRQQRNQIYLTQSKPTASWGEERPGEEVLNTWIKRNRNSSLSTCDSQSVVVFYRTQVVWTAPKKNAIQTHHCFFCI